MGNEIAGLLPTAGAANMSSNVRSNRPLSPHLSIYKPQITTVISIFHRITGVAVTGGIFLVSAWLLTAAYAPDSYDSFRGIAGSIYGQIVLFVLSLCFYFHSISGIRHLFWDMGKGFEIKTVTRTGIFTIILSILLTLITWVAIKS